MIDSYQLSVRPVVSARIIGRRRHLVRVADRRLSAVPPAAPPAAPSAAPAARGRHAGTERLDAPDALRNDAEDADADPEARPGHSAHDPVAVSSDVLRELKAGQLDLAEGF